MEKKILIFAGTYNEAENIKNFIEKILELNINLANRGALIEDRRYSII